MVDIRTTHDFVDPMTTERLRLKLTEVRPFEATVVSKEKLEGCSISRGATQYSKDQNQDRPTSYSHWRSTGGSRNDVAQITRSNIVEFLPANT